MIVAAEGWVWRFPGSYFDRPSIPAYSPVESRPEAGGRYFTGFKATELSAGEIRKLHETFGKTLVTYTDASPPAIRCLASGAPTASRRSRGLSHLAHLGFPVRGDPAYLVGSTLGESQTLDVDAPPLCLHAWRISFRQDARS